MSWFDGTRVRTLRCQAGICVEDLAAAAGVSPNTVRAAESGRHQPHPRVAAALATALGVEIADLSTPCPILTLREVRARMGLTQTEMAARIGVARQMVSRVERGVGGVGAPTAWAAAYGLAAEQWKRAFRASRDVVRAKVTARTSRGESG
ncbi:transcriptional regulator [Streptomyces sp. JJ66]|uniref:helix-turn-helix transcriptional regulator n=1 Tax=Streptomyces sp. JJ66 TaxID=2803843 RepID=UPI001C587180|nr:transcriptional regulator [Streptomyces sp. JJ66]